jgi:holo-[acyl-carrier protein] synthase
LIGIDIIEIERIEAAAKRRPRILQRLFTSREVALAARQRSASTFYAGRFAAKEAVAKALRAPLSWHEVEVLSDSDGVPVANLSGRAQSALSLSGCASVYVSISHCREYAVAAAVLVKEDQATGCTMQEAEADRKRA